MSEDQALTAQLPLALRLSSAETFETFVVEGHNATAFAHVSGVAEGKRREAIWLTGGTGAGKSHLLQAACAAAGQRAIYVPLERHAELAPGMLSDLDALDLVALDAIDAVAGRDAWERALFDVLNAASAAGAAILLSARDVPSAVAFALPDLASRAAGAVVYRLAGLSDEGRITALIRHASSRGLDLDGAAARFLAQRVRRDMGTLCRWLDELHALALSTRRPVTIPMIRSALAARPARDAAREQPV